VQIFIVFLSLPLLTLVFFLILSRQEKEKTEFFHVMAHRFRSPISIIRWYVELLSDKSVGDLNDKQKMYLNEIFNSSEKLNETIDSLIILLQIQSGNLILKKEKVNIKDLIAKIVQRLKLRIERRKINLREIYPQEQEAIIQTDSRLLGVVLQNLIENGIKYSQENGDVCIKVKFLNKKMLIEIIDNGYGIPKTRKSKILADSVNSKDMGLSLYLVKSISRKIKADISFKSEEDKETTFSISLPANA
jgi:two-component system, OmpR family, phosphate regulon sensor histidine kinase PhoR